MPAPAIFLLDLVFAIVVVATGVRIGEFFRRLRGGGEPGDGGGGPWPILPSAPGGAAGRSFVRGHRRHRDPRRPSGGSQARRPAVAPPRRAPRR